MRHRQLASAVTLATGLAVWGGSAAAQVSPAKLETTVEAVPLVGSADIDQLVAGKPPSERDALIDAAILRVKANQSFQLSVVLVANGTRTTVTSSPNIMYEHDGCLTVSQSGLVTVTPSRTCAGAKYLSLIVVLVTDDKKDVIAANEYFFKVTD